jgi:hypothetical protein
LAKAADQFRSSDVTHWGIVALVAWTLAVLLANISAILPADLLGLLHASRLEGGTLNQLREQVAEIRSESDRLQRENNLLLQRFLLAEEARGEVARRVGALETSLPRLAERVPEQAPVDDSVTASVIAGKALTFEAEGGSVSVTHKPLVAIERGVATPAGLQAPEVAMPPDGSQFGIALGFPVAEGESDMLWQDLMAKVGTLLIGLWPVTTDAENGDGKLLIAGPINSETQAAELCGRLDRLGIPCEPVPFRGDPLPLLN